MKFYTREGNWDLVANHIPVFFIRDAFLFPDVIHAIKRDPRDDLKSPHRFWDFMSAHPESVHTIMMLFSDRGTPASYAGKINGYGNHTFKLVNNAGEIHWCKFHIRAVEGIEVLSAEAAEELRMHNPDHLHRDLHEFLADGNEAVWLLQAQVRELKGNPANANFLVSFLVSCMVAYLTFGNASFFVADYP